MQGQAAAGQALEEAMAATREAAQRVDATVSILRQVQVRAFTSKLCLAMITAHKVVPTQPPHFLTPAATVSMQTPADDHATAAFLNSVNSRLCVHAKIREQCLILQKKCCKVL